MLFISRSLCIPSAKFNYIMMGPMPSSRSAASKTRAHGLDHIPPSMMQDAVVFPACFSSVERLIDEPASPLTKSQPQSLIMSVYKMNIASQSRLVTITWCKNLLLHGLSVSVDGPSGDHHYHCKIELKPWYFWRKQGSKQFVVDGKTVGVVWDLKGAKFNGEVEPQSDYYVAVVSDEEVVLVVGDLKKDAFRRTGCRPALLDPVLVSRKEHVFGKRKFATKVKFHEKERSHEISVECSSNGSINKSDLEGFSSEMEIKVDGQVATHVKHLQWKFRGNQVIEVNKLKVEVCWDVHDWLFGSGPRHAVFLFKPVLANTCSASLETCESGGTVELSEFCLFLYAWKVE